MGKRRDVPDEPTLELPSFFRRRKRRADDAGEGEPGLEARSADSASESVPAPEPERVPEPARESEPVLARQPEPAPEPAPAPQAEPTTVAEPEPARPGAAEPAAAEPAPAEPVSAPAPGGRKAARASRKESRASRRAARAARAPRTRPVLSSGAASLIVGAVVGAVGTGLTWAALQGCEALRGTDSCGGPGLLVLGAILALMVIAGALLLKALRISEPNATSFLGVGLMTVIVLVTLMESLFSAWMFLAVPVLSALCYLAAQWVSTRFVDTEKASPGVDVR